MYYFNPDSNLDSPVFTESEWRKEVFNSIKSDELPHTLHRLDENDIALLRHPVSGATLLGTAMMFDANHATDFLLRSGISPYAIDELGFPTFRGAIYNPRIMRILLEHYPSFANNNELASQIDCELSHANYELHPHIHESVKIILEINPSFVSKLKNINFNYFILYSTKPAA
jgi:hypothetical protein